MRIGLFAGVAVAGLVLTAAQPAQPAAEPIDPLLLSTICSNESESAGGSAPAAVNAPKMLPGFGNGGFAVTTDKPEAQRWFSYGVELAQAFAHEPAKAAFREAARLDPECAMCAWGEAWAAGPTINYRISGEERAAARVLAVRAQQLAITAGLDKERRLAAAMVRRYAPVGGDVAFANEMETLAAAFPDDDALQVIAADALLVSGHGKQPKRSVALLEAVLTRNPTHTGAIHFYIHASEWIGQAEKAEQYADRLAGLAPGASHLIHMPSHTFYRVGRYREAGRTNLAAIAVDKAWIRTTGADESGWKIPYYGHNVRFALGGAMMAGDAEAALQIADHYGDLPVDLMIKQSWWQSGAASAWFARGRYGDPDKLLAMPAPDDRLPFVRAMWRYGRGEALARKGDAKGVLAEVAVMTLTAKEMAPYRGGYSNVTAQLEIARLTLLGRAAMIEGRHGEAAGFYRKAAERQLKAFGDGGDPPTWWYPARRSLAAALLASGQTDKALKEARAVLDKWPRDPLSLLLVARAETALGHPAAAAEALAGAKAGWSGEALEGFSLNRI
jgi:tetratricopeptide (TPR) repeat protein